MSELDPRFETLAYGMLDEEIVKFGSFRLKSGKESVAYINLREMISVPHLFQRATKAYENVLRETDMLEDSAGKSRLLAGIPEAAVYYAGAVAPRTESPLIQHRVKTKEHGQPRPIEGRFEKGDEVILLDDVITSAESKLNEVESLGSAGLKVAGVAVLVDREQGGRTEIETRGIEFASAMTLSGIAKYALDENVGNMTQAGYDELLAELNPAEIKS